MDSMRKLIITGAMAPDEKLPSVRELAQQLAINPNTIQRAYRELEQEGYIYSVAGKGNFVGKQNEVDNERKKELIQTLCDAARELQYLGVSYEEIVKTLSEGGRKDD